MDKHNRIPLWVIVVMLLLLIPLELACAFLSFETGGEVVSAANYLLVGVNLIFIILAFKYRHIAVIGIAILAVAMIPYQALMGHRLIRIQAEASRIVTWAYEEKLAVGNFPASLESYAYHDTTMEEFIHRYEIIADGEDFVIYYRVATESTPHWYNSSSGWDYYPD